MQERTTDAADGVSLHISVCGAGPDVLMLSGGPGCVQYLEHEQLALVGYRNWFPEPRGVGRSAGGPHTMDEAISDLETIRKEVGVGSWTVVGHSWGSDLAVRYAVEHPERVTAVVGVAGHGLHRDRTWSAAYHAREDSEPKVDIPWDEDVWRALGASFDDWIHEPGLFRALADSTVPMHFVAAGDDIRPSWPLEQLAMLVPRGRFSLVPGVPHDFWHSHPETWRAVVGEACAAP